MFPPLLSLGLRITMPLLVRLIVKILSWNPPSKEIHTLQDQVLQKLGALPALEEVLPPIPLTDLKPSLDYQTLLQQAQDQGKPIRPVRHRKPLDPHLTCPDCGAPADYLYSNATIFLPHLDKTVQKHRCKLCSRQWFPLRARKHLTLCCPYCGGRIDLKTKRRAFDKFKCVTPSCPYRLQTGHRYTWRDYSLCLEILERFAPPTPKASPIHFSRSQFSFTAIATTLFCFVSFPLSCREVTLLMEGLFQLSVSPQTILNWAYAMAYLLYPLLSSLPVHPSNLWVVDETYLLYEGKWGYLFTVLDGEQGSILAQVFSPTRSVAGAYAVLHQAARRLHLAVLGPITIVSDGLASYPPAIQLLRNQFNHPFLHIPVIGLKDGPVKNEYRKYKNLIENYYSVLKPHYYRTRGFGSFQGAVVFSILFQVYYNYLHPSDRCGDKPIVPIEGLDYTHPVLAWKSLIEKASAA